MSQAKMRVLKPQIDEINKKIPADKAMERQQAMMKLYKRAGVNPMGGCLPMLLQMPILICSFLLLPRRNRVETKKLFMGYGLSFL